MSPFFIGSPLKLVLLAVLSVDDSQGAAHVRLLRRHRLKEHESRSSNSGHQPRLPDGYEPPAALCIRDTGRICTPYDSGSGAIVDQMGQCHSAHHGYNFSAPSPRYSRMSTSGECDHDSAHCLCKPGFCADADLNCYPGAYEMLSTPFRITTKSYGLDKALYMTRDGKVFMGDPPSQAAATWHVSVSPMGVKHLVTGAFRNVVLEEREECTELVRNGFPVQQCLGIVGHTEEPRADSTGWRFEAHSDFVDERSGESGIYLQIKSVHAGKYMFVNPPPLAEMHICVSGGHAGCPGEYGALRFDPPFPLDLIDTPPILGADAAVSYFWNYLLACVLMALVYKTYSNLEAKSSRFDDDLSWFLVIPLRNLANCVGLRNVF